MGNSKTKFDLDDLKKCVDKDEKIGEFIPVSGTVVMNGEILTPSPYQEKNYQGNSVKFFLEKLGAAGGVTYEFKEEYSKIIRETLVR
jgi:hypothetical protein